MLFGAFGRDEDVVDIDIDSRNISQYGVHQTLEILTGVFQAERGPVEDEQSKWGYDPRLCHVIRIDGNLVVAFEEIYLQKDFLSLELVNGI